MGVLLLALFSMGLIGFSFDGSGDDAVPETGEDPSTGSPATNDPTPTAGDDILVLNGSTENPGGYIDDLGEGNLLFDGATADLPELDLGAGNDVLTVESGPAIITTGDGSDTIDAHGMTAGLIFADEDDLVLGSDVVQDGYPPIGIVADGAIVEGGLANEFIVATGTGAAISGGGGSDVIHVYSGNVAVSGGAGDDVILGNADDNRFCQCTRASSVSSYSNGSSDTLDGGDGDDRIELSRGDIATGGDGADTFQLYDGGDAGSTAATVTDFSPSEDLLSINVAGGDPWDYRDPSYDLTGRVTSVEEGGGTIIMVDGEAAAAIEGVTGLRLGIPDMSSLSETGRILNYIDVDTGDIDRAASFGVLIEVFQTRSS